ncbi:MAG: hypothetical protein IJ801_00985 [Lachnospiraceae bacterium]|nr:hypothetical protein [Lachnospiraceae bacterium]
MKDFIKLVTALAAYNDGRYDGYRIGKACFELAGQICLVDSTIQKEKENYLVLEVTGYDANNKVRGNLTVTLMKQPEVPASSVWEHKGQTGSDAGVLPDVFSFGPDQVDRYLDTVQDTNPVHRGEAAIVPGLMLVDFLLDRKLLVLRDARQEIRFRKPLPVGTVFSAIHVNRSIWITSPDRQQCYATVCRKGERNV